MYVHIIEFEVKEGEDLTFIESQKFAENTVEKPAGLNHFHIFKDLNRNNVYYLLEYWDKKTDREKLEESTEYIDYRNIRNTFIEKKNALMECEKIV